MNNNDTIAAYYANVTDADTMLSEYNCINGILKGELELVNKTDEGYWFYKNREGVLMLDTSTGA